MCVDGGVHHFFEMTPKPNATVNVMWLFLTVPRVCLWFVIIEFPHQTHFLFYIYLQIINLIVC